MKYKRWNFVIEGIKPGFLMSSPENMGGDGGIGKPKKPPPVADARSGLYVDPDGFLFTPTLWFRKLIIYGAGGYKLGKNSARTILSGALGYDMDNDKFYPTRDGRKLTDNLPPNHQEYMQVLLAHNGLKAEEYDAAKRARTVKFPPQWDWIPWSTRCVINKAGVNKARALVFVPWTIEGFMEFDAEMGVKGSDLAKFMEVGGRGCGIGDYAPRKGGWHGKFELKKHWVEGEAEPQPMPATEETSKEAKKRKAG